MEVSTTIFNPSLKIFGTEKKTHVSSSSISLNSGRRRLSGENLCFSTGKARKFVAVCRSGFTDSGHLEYYVKAKMKKDKEKNSEIKEVKKKLKVFKRFSKDMALVTGVESENGLIGEVKGKMISEAMEMLQRQVRQMKAEQKELKKQKKAELKSTMPKSKAKPDSSSSESECDTLLRTIIVNELELTTLAAPSTILQQQEAVVLNLQPKCCNEPQTSCSTNRKVLEICMGGKCKKMGAVALLEEFEKKIGDQGEVVGCKCMGKCKSAPNVRLKNHVQEISQSEFGDNGSIKLETNPLFIGVSLGDVSEVVSTFLGKQSMHNCMVVAPA